MAVYTFKQKIHESKPFMDFSYNAFKQNAILINSRNLRHGVWQIDSICQT